MATTQKAEPIGKVVTIPVRLSYFHGWEPTSMEGSGDKKYSTSILIPKTETVFLAKLQEKINAVIQDGIKSKWGGKLPANLKTPLRDGDKERGDDASYKDMMFFTASSKQKPGIVDKERNPILDETEVYSGCFARVSLNFYAFNTAGSKGVAAGLNNIQKWADGEPLAGRSSPDEDFADDDLV